MKRKTTPKYRQLKHEILSWIHSGRFQPGDAIPSEHELASQYGISRHTVRQAITELAHEGWLIREQGRGTFVASGQPAPDPHVHVQRPRSGLVAVVTTYISDYIFPSIIEGMESVLTPRGFTILLLNTRNDFQQEAQAISSILEHGAEAVIVEATKSSYPNPNLAHYFRLLERQVPMVMLHSDYLELGVPCIRVDDAGGCEQVTRHLLEMGHRFIGGIFKQDDMQGRHRLRGFVRALRAFGAPLHPEWLLSYETPDMDTVAALYIDRFARHLPGQRPTAVVCYNDYIALQLIRACKQHGFSVPEDISVVGFDDFQLALAGEVQLTTVRHPKFRMGVKAAEWILEMISEARAVPCATPNAREHAGAADGGNETAAERPREFVFTPELVLGTSVRRVPLD
ncbi:arabinose metabolism transcriptional repressor [Alicyclobacillus cellulosilyticus]|uniref:Arabinose metabolism transcriptional repressor n=1 Tax=Alicyclobacillus cellulosilyticus TaxID=1003997 RepID=A0A917K5S6_9BACL|nr:GntR family transcriptional regulator [Alicyclobacillus cellulosilyticus]GGJ02085.1 arabinose metabolism transcriptional repressor [Alicyclobacillus cellulosilyticus]